MDNPKPKCPGSLRSALAKPCEVKCPACGSSIEIWSDEIKATCAKCGRFVFASAVPVCVVWCGAAEECLGDVLDVKKIKAEALECARREESGEKVERIMEMVKAGPVCAHRREIKGRRKKTED